MILRDNMKDKSATFIVGNKFKDFSLHEQVLTLSELINTLNNEPACLKHVCLVPGQGLSEADISDVLSLIDSGINNDIDAELFRSRPARAGMAITHKRKFVNSIISNPRRLSAELYEADLLVDERSELMNDHQTGQHIQGMILVEAARQMFLAVTEEFFIASDDSRDYYFVINQMDTRYMAFVFPIDSVLRYEVLEKSLDNPERLSFNVRITVHQAGIDATEVMVKFTTFLADKIKEKEHRQAMDVLSKQQQFLTGFQTVQSS
jgi:hypothetical protein